MHDKSLVTLRAPSTTAPVHVRQPFQADFPARLQRKWAKYVSLERLTYIRRAVVLAGSRLFGLGSARKPVLLVLYQPVTESSDLIRR
jgi:hypothetical protein